MNSLYLLQFGSFLFMLINAAILGLSSLHTQWENKRYEHSRWLIVIGYLFLSFQYLAQMIWGLRASGDAVGALVNMLVYPLCFSLISMGIYHIEATHSRRRKMKFSIFGFCSAIYLSFGIGYWVNGSVHIGVWFYVMLAFYMASVVYDVVVIYVEMQKRRKMLETMAANDMLPYLRYSRASLLILFMAALVMPFAILSTTLLLIVGPFVLCALLFFTVTFISLGNNYVPSEELLDDEVERVVTLKQAKVSTVEEDTEMVQTIRKNLDAWCAEGGYKDSAVNLLLLSRALNVSKTELSQYFDQCLQTNFRMWLSDIRFEAAKKMMLENPTYSNDVISLECGFSSRSQLYRIFSSKVGCSPNAWRNKEIH